MKPTWRKPVGVLSMVVGLILYSALIVAFSGPLGTLPALAQAPIYLILGILWILPLKPLLRWMETGKWRE